jgi:hypothetical protein
MEIELTIRNEDISEKDLSREADSLRREILRRYPNAIWEKCGEGHRIFV